MKKKQLQLLVAFLVGAVSINVLNMVSDVIIALLK